MLLLLLVSIKHPLRREGRTADSNLRDTTPKTSPILSPRPLHEGFQIGFTKSRSGRDASVLCGYYPALALPPRLITSYVPARHPPTADGRQSRWWEYRSTFCYKRHLFTISQQTEMLLMFHLQLTPI